MWTIGEPRAYPIRTPSNLWACCILICGILVPGQSLSQSPSHQALTFEERCADPLVVLCDPLDEGRVQGIAINEKTPRATLPQALKGKYGDWRWCGRGNRASRQPPAIDQAIKTSGSGSLKFTVPSQSKEDASGYCQINFTPNNSVQFGEGETFYVQYRVRFSCELLYLVCDPQSPQYKKLRRAFRASHQQATAYKLSIINAGDHAELEFPVNSCTNQHLVLIGDRRGVIQGYHSCGLYDGHRQYLGLDQRTGSNLFDLQPKLRNKADKLRVCLNSKPSSSKLREDEPSGCALLVADEWLTLTQQVTIGQWANKLSDPRRSSNVKLWIAREGRTPELVIDYDRNLMAPEKSFMKYGKIWLLPFMTGKDPTEIHPDAYMWFDELIISRGPIAAAR